MKKLPNFFHYDNVETGFETLQDFFLQWTFRCSGEENKLADEKVQKMAKLITLLILEKASGIKFNPEKTKISKVETFRQKSRIDLIAKIEIVDHPKPIVLNIENKRYTMLRNGQLENGKTAIRNLFNESENEIFDCVIYEDNCKINEPNNLKDYCKNQGYALFSIEDLNTTMDNNLTGNYMFDSYWFSI